MANTTNIMAIAPNQAASSTRTTSQSAQPKYRPATRQGRKNFGATLDKANAKLDDTKQGVTDLQDTGRKPAQVDEDAKSVTEQKTAQGTSDTPQDAPQQDEKLSAGEKISTQPTDKPTDTKSAPEEEIQTADIFFRSEEESEIQPQTEAPQPTATETEIPTDAPKSPITCKLPLRNLLWQKIFTAPESQPEEKIPDDGVKTSATELEPQTTLPILNNAAYFFATSADLPTEIKPVEVSPLTEIPKIDAVQKLQPAQNLMSLMPQADDNAHEMLNLLGGKTWRIIETPQPLNVQPQVQVQTQPVDVQPQVQVQTQPVDVQPQVQVQTQPVDVQPTVQIQTQPVDVQPTVQIQTQPVDVQPTVQIQTQPVDVQQPVQVQTQPVDVQPPVQVQTQPVDVQQPVQVQTQPVDVQPQVQVQTQPVDVQPPVQIQTQPVDVQQPAQVQAQPVDVQQPVQVQTQPVDVQQPVQIQTQPVDVQPQVQVQTQPVDVQPQVQVQTQPVDVQQPVQIQTQPVDVQQPAQVQTQPVDVQQPVQVQTQPVDVQQPTQVQAQPVDVQQPAQVQTQAQPVEIQPQAQVELQAAQPVAQQKVDAQPVQVLSDVLGVNVQIEDAPVTAPQSTPQHFEQENSQQDAQNFQRQNFTAPTEQQSQPVSTGGEIFAAPIATNNAPQPQQPQPVQAPDAPPPTPQDDFDVPGQIVRQARLIRTATNTEMVIKLNPEHLGELTLRVSVSSSGAVNASFHSDNAQVRTIIENSLVQLRQELNNQGLKVENVQVYAGLSEDGGLMNGQGGQAWQQNRQQRQGNRRIAIDALEREADSATPVNENSATEGVDYSV